MNIKQFADAMGVSTATVSRAFSERGRISPATRELLRRKARELGYRANPLARSLSTRVSDTIGLFYPSIGKREPDYFMTEIALGVSETAAAAGKLLRVHPFSDSLGEDERETLKNHALNGGLAGMVVVAGARLSKELAKAAEEAGTPFVVLGHMSGFEEHTVAFATEKGAAQAGRYFLSTGRGRPAYVGGAFDHRKRKAFAAGLGALAAKLVSDPGGYSFRDGHLAFGRLASPSLEVDCVLCANDAIAIGFVRAALERGVKIPQELAVIGCDDIAAARYFSPALTTISLHEHEIGARAVQRLLDRVAGKGPAGLESLDTELIVRESA